MPTKATIRPSIAALSSNTTVKDFIAEHDEIRTRVDAVLVGSTVDKTTFDGDTAEVNRTLGAIYFSLGERDKAQAYWDRAKALERKAADAAITAGGTIRRRLYGKGVGFTKRWKWA